MYIHIEGSEKRNDIFCICSCAIVFFGLDSQTIGTNPQTLDGFFGASYIDTEFHDIFRFKLIFLDIANVLNSYQLILAHKGDKMRFLTFILVKYTKVRVFCFHFSFSWVDGIFFHRWSLVGCGESLELFL